MSRLSLVKIIPAAAGAFALACAGTPLFAQQAPGGAERLELVAAGTVTESENVVMRRYPGRVVSPATIAVTARVPGDLLEAATKEGDIVRKGQPLYRVGDMRYVAAVKTAVAQIAQYRARVA